MTVSLAIVGLGGWGPNLARNAASVAGARVAALCDLAPARLDVVGQHHPDARRVADFESILADPAIDAVVLATPAALHEEQTLAALSAGKHVLVEKPLALSVAGGERIVEAAGHSGRVLMCGHTFLYNESVRTMKRLVDAGELGDVYCVIAERLSLGKIRDDVNAMWNLAPHDFAILNYLFGGAPTRVRATGGKFLPGSTLEDVVFAGLEYPCGALAQVHSSWLNPLKVRRMTVIGQHRMLVYDDVSEDRRIVVYDQGVDSTAFDDPSGSFVRFRRAIRKGSETVVPVEFREPLAVELEHFVACIRDGAEPLTGAAEALGVLRVLEGCQRSLERDGEPVSLETLA